MAGLHGKSGANGSMEGFAAIRIPRFPIPCSSVVAALCSLRSLRLNSCQESLRNLPKSALEITPESLWWGIRSLNPVRVNRRAAIARRTPCLAVIVMLATSALAASAADLDHARGEFLAG